MTNPAMPAQPAKPAEPKKPFDQTGGYVQPPPPGSNAGPLPGGAPPAPTPGAPSPSAPGAAPSPSSVQTTPVGVPPQAAQIGLDEQAYQQVVEEAKESPEPEEFKAQFATLMEQRNMIAPRTQGGGLPTEEYGKYLSKWMSEAVAFAATPAEFGGKGYTPGQAKMMAIVEARRRWPDIQPQFWTQSLPGGKVSPKDLGVTAVGSGSEKAAVEVSPYRAARLDPTKVADILTKKEFKTAVEWATEFKERLGPGANASAFVQDVFDRQVAQATTGGKKLQTELDTAKATLAEAEAYQAQVKAQQLGLEQGAYKFEKPEEATKFAQQVEEAAAASELNLANAKATVEAAEVSALDTKIPDEAGAMEIAVKFIQDNQDVLSVAAALNQLY